MAPRRSAVPCTIKGHTAACRGNFASPPGRAFGSAARYTAQLNQPLPLQQPAEARDDGVPFPSLVYVIESPVMQLITAPQRELQIIVLPHRAGRRWPGYRKGLAVGRKYGRVAMKRRG